MDAVLKHTYEEGDGLIMMAVKDIFRQMAIDSDIRYIVTCSFMEVYNDSVYDLLNPVERLADELQIIEINVCWNNFRTNSLLKGKLSQLS